MSQKPLKPYKLEPNSNRTSYDIFRREDNAKVGTMKQNGTDRKGRQIWEVKLFDLPAYILKSKDKALGVVRGVFATAHRVNGGYRRATAK